MSKTGEYTLEWLQFGGFNLGYSEHDLPKMNDMDYVLEHKIQVWEYKGMTEEEYYG